MIECGVAQLMVIRDEKIYPNVRSKRKYQRETPTEHEIGAHTNEWTLGQGSGKHTIDDVEYGSNSWFFDRGRRGVR